MTNRPLSDLCPRIGKFFAWLIFGLNCGALVCSGGCSKAPLEVAVDRPQQQVVREPKPAPAEPTAAWSTPTETTPTETTPTETTPTETTPTETTEVTPPESSSDALVPAQSSPAEPNMEENAKEVEGLNVAAFPEPIQQPNVYLSDEHERRCRVKVGDKFPDGEFVCIPDGVVRLSDLYGKRFTLVHFWSSDSRSSMEQMNRMRNEVQRRFRTLSLAIVSINAGDEGSEVETVQKNVGRGRKVLLDPRGEFLEKVYDGPVPCCYLLDDAGRILWFDIEYSGITRRELRNALRFFGADRDS